MSNDTVSTYDTSRISIILHLIKTYDRVNRNFLSWNTSSTVDTETLTLTLCDDAVIDLHLMTFIYAQCPCTMKSIILKKKTITFEILKNKVIDNLSMSKNVNEPPCKKHKHEHQDASNDNNDFIQDIIKTTIKIYNPLSVDVSPGIEYTDMKGSGLRFKFIGNEVINLTFCSSLIGNAAMQNVKVICYSVLSKNNRDFM